MNNWFQKNEKQKLGSWLKSEPGFKYDKTNVKQRLMMSVKHASQGEAEETFSWKTMPNWGVVLAALVIMLGSATFAYADQARPGDILFPVNKLNDKIILNLPFSAQTKARIQAQIVSKRLDALDQVTKDDSSRPDNSLNRSKKLETIKESRISLTTAIQKVTEAKKMLEDNGNTTGAEALRQTLTHLEELAGQQEEKIQYLEEHAIDKADKKEIGQHLSEIKKERKKASDALKIRELEND
jgi:hypothetical protein